MRATIKTGDVAGLLQIASEVNELGNELHARRAHVLNRLLELIGATWAVCSEMDPRYVTTNGWAIPNTITHAGRLSAHDQDVINRYLTGALASLDPCVPFLLGVKKLVVTIRREDVIDKAWYQSDHYNNVRRPLGLGESLYGKLITPDGRLMKMSFQREVNDPPFSERDVQVLQVFNENLAGAYAVRTCGGVEPNGDRMASLPRRLRPVLQRLLVGDSEKQAAVKLGLSQHTIHEYTKGLYHSFGVNSRSELLAQFVVRDVQ